MESADGPFLDEARVRAALAGTQFADVRVVARTGSTNDDAAPLLSDPRSAGATIVAEEQTAGRGRVAGRRWIAPAGSALTFTTILPRTVASGALWAVPFWTALGVADGIEAACGARVALRWPNDLDLNGRKVCGILGTSRVAGNVAHVGCGIGINVRRPAEPTPIEPPPAYLSETAPGVERETVLAAVLGALDALLDLLDRPAAIARAWEDRAGLPGISYRVRLDATDELLAGTALRLDPEGALVLDVEGKERIVRLAEARVVP